MIPPKPASTRRYRRVRLALVPLGIVLALFAWTGLRTDWRTPRVVESEFAISPSTEGVLTIATLNLAKLGFHSGGWRFASRRSLQERLDRVADVLSGTNADLICLSEAVHRCGPVQFDQVQALAEGCGYRYRVYVPNYDFGLPFFRISSGNALLARVPLREAQGEQLAGAKPFFAPANNRRILWCEARIADRWWTVASVQNDSFDPSNNLRQVEQILERLGGAPALLAGDLNADPDSPGGQRWRNAKQLSMVARGAPTYPASEPIRRIDDVLWPNSWKLLEQDVFDTGVSDHLGVVVRLVVPTGPE